VAVLGERGVLSTSAQIFGEFAMQHRPFQGVQLHGRLGEDRTMPTVGADLEGGAVEANRERADACGRPSKSTLAPIHR